MNNNYYYYYLEYFRETALAHGTVTGYAITQQIVTANNIAITFLFMRKILQVSFVINLLICFIVVI